MFNPISDPWIVSRYFRAPVSSFAAEKEAHDILKIKVSLMPLRAGHVRSQPGDDGDDTLAEGKEEH